ncbi:MAG: tRNA-dihydrouridine synthase [Candidatus Saccharibacteria bacterium]|nr:tRNA-dihydrouridine synthase [Candidatus Saccharibacteria bacterium]
MMINFWNDLNKPFFILAPMEAVTDIVFRHVVATAAKPDIFFTEFANATSFCSEKGRHSTKRRLLFTSDEQPIVAQIWGNNPDNFAKMSVELAKMGFSGIDINMGCPDKSVLKTGSGSALIRTPEVAGELIRAAKTSGLPVSVKTRLGDVSIEQWKDWIEFLLNQDIANLTIHLRTRKEMSKVGAHYELITEIKKLRDKIAPKTLLAINGDIRDKQHGVELANKYEIDGIMIGRGIFTNPFAFDTENRGHSRVELLGLLQLHLDLYDKYSTESEPLKFDPLKRFFKMYVHDFPGASELRDKLMHTTNTKGVRQLINDSDLLQPK